LSVFTEGVALLAVLARTRGCNHLLVSVCVSEVPIMVPFGAVNDVPQAEPVDTAIPLLGYVVGPVEPVTPVYPV
jgi:hypothetical protein